MRVHLSTLAGSTGAQQRLRHGLGEHKPYRWHGKPGWNPAAVLDGWLSAARKQRTCPKCGAKPGEQCHTKNGKVMRRSNHDGR